jgi:hypothetical protein
MGVWFLACLIVPLLIELVFAGIQALSVLPLELLYSAQSFAYVLSCFGLLGSIPFCAVWLPKYWLRSAEIRRVHLLHTYELEEEAYTVPAAYFQLIGAEDNGVLRFLELLARRDIDSLRSEWPTLRQRFHALERKAGYRGPALVFEYFPWYDVRLREFSMRPRSIAK